MRRARLGETQLAFRVSGHGDQLVALVHSYTTSSRAWEPLIARLGARYTFLSIDLRGHGETSPPSEKVAIADLAEDVANLLDALGIDEIDFLGLSIGGMIGQAFALNHGDRLGRLVLACTTGRLDADAGPVWDGRLADICTNGLEGQVEPTLKRWFGGAYDAMDPLVLKDVAEMIRETSIEGALKLGEAVKRHDLLNELSAITAPTLVIAGAQDLSFPLYHAENLRAAIPGCELAVIEGAGHQAALQKPDEFAAIVDEFLSR